MPAPTFVASYVVSSWDTSTTPKTVTPTTAAGDFLCVLAAAEDNDATLGTPSGNSLTYTVRQQSAGTPDDASRVSVWTAPATAATGWTLTGTRGGTALKWGFITLRFSGSGGYGGGSVATAGSGAPSLNITTTQANSAIAVIVADWNAADGTSRTWRTVNGVTPTAGNTLERVYFRNGLNYTVYSAYYSDAGAAGVKTVGLSAPAGQTYSIIAIEILGTAGGVNHSATVTDSVEITDTVLRSSQVVRSVSDSADVVDTIADTSGYVTGVIDAVSTDDSLTFHLFTTETLTDLVGISDTVEASIDSPGGEHSIFGDDPYPATLGLFTDGTPNILLGNAFYTFTEATAGWRCVGARLYIPDGIIQTDPVPVGFWPYAGVGDGPDLSTAPLRTATIEAPVTGWNEVRWNPIEVTPNVPFWIAYDLGGGRYLANTGLTLDPIQAVDGASLYLSEGNMSGVGARAYFRIGSGGTSAGGSTGYGVDMLVDEGSSGGEELTGSAIDDVSISDSVIVHMHMHRAVADAVGVADPVVSQTDVVESITDPVELTDALAGRLDRVVSLVEAVFIIDDNADQAVGFTIDLVDVVNVDDSALATQHFSYRIEDLVSVSDSVMADESGDLNVVDSVPVTDAIEPVKNITVTLTDVLQVTDASDRVADLVRSTVSTIDMADGVSTADQFLVDLTDTVGIFDDNTNQSVHSSVLIEDHIGVADSTTARGNITLDLVDAVDVADSRQVVLVVAEGPSPSQFEARILSSRWSARLVLPSRVVRSKLG
jgi:hypothetical protein